ncbi:hypothetical protein BH23GEM9_BH23GEM9_14660 [soil metagenome]
MTLHRVLLGFLMAVLLAALVPAGLVLERRIVDALEVRTHEEMSLMPRVLAARQASASDGFMMYAKEVASTAGLAAAVARGDRAEAERLLAAASRELGGPPVLVTAAHETWVGAYPGAELVASTRAGAMPVEVVADAAGVRTVALSPLMAGSEWVGAAGYAVALDRVETALLAGLTRSDVHVVTVADGGLAASSRDDDAAPRLLAALSSDALVSGAVTERRVDGRRLLVAAGAAGADAVILFVRDLDAELAVVPALRRTALLSAAGAFVLALLLGTAFSGALVRPARNLADAADRLAAGDFDAPLRGTRIREFRRVTDAFATMRRALAQRVTELESANRELAERQRRLAELQAELIRRDRLATAGQLVGQLAHEIRNPVANVRNCLELLRRRTSDPDAQELAELATDELLRMHELAERVLDLHRPAPDRQKSCDAAAVARNTAALMRLSLPELVSIQVTGSRSQPAALPPDTLKQVLMTLMQNAAEAMAGGGAIELHVGEVAGAATVEVTDTGPGIPPDVLPRIFDPFFTTKDGVQGVGLGLFIAEGLLRSHGCRIGADNTEPHGARFRLELPRTAASAAALVTSGAPS